MHIGVLALDAVSSAAAASISRFWPSGEVQAKCSFSWRPGTPVLDSANKKTRHGE